MHPFRGILPQRRPFSFNDAYFRKMTSINRFCHLRAPHLATWGGARGHMDKGWDTLGILHRVCLRCALGTCVSDDVCMRRVAYEHTYRVCLWASLKYAYMGDAYRAPRL